MAEKPKLVIFPIPMRAWEALTRDLPDREERALFNLVAYYAMHGGLPVRDEAMAHIARVSVRTWRNQLRGVLALKFPVEGWRWPEIDQMIAHREKILVQKSVAGKQGNFKRWGSTAVPANQLPKRKFTPRSN